ncbi:hypothetical protein BV898_04431 [Hypsibius exemplaris]|uniref:Uncharacterized protein n=1 Tax=Hypsibius exemplaris TaxID=2072580 RepID=A0A1W0X219_HYPEX|nr:hypothetical protein BV898_04431 [Hypsibius exemplaris]
MSGQWTRLIFHTALWLTCGSRSISAATTQSVGLKHYNISQPIDNSTAFVRLDCDETEAGTLTLNISDLRSRNDDSVRVYLNVNRTSCRGTNRLYLNIRLLKLQQEYSLLFYDTADPTPSTKPIRIVTRTSITALDDDNSPLNTGTPLLVQLLTPSDNVLVELKHERDKEAIERGTLVIDYTIIRQEAHQIGTATYLQCDSLKGYIRREYICETGSRVSCPAQYISTRHSENVNLTFRRADRPKLCDEDLTAEWTVGNIATVVAVVVLVLILLGLVCLYYYCKKRQTKRPEGEGSVSYGTISESLEKISRTHPGSRPRTMPRTAGGINFRHGSWTQSPFNGPPPKSL